MDTTSTIDVQEVAFTLLATMCRSKPKRLEATIQKEEISIPEDFFGGQARYQTKEEVFQDAAELLIRAFDSLDLYALRKKKKRSGGFRVLSVPPDDLKKVQRKLLRWLSRLQKRTLYYCSGTYAGEQAYTLLSHKNIKEHFIDQFLHGSLQERSVSTAVKKHAVANDNFIVEFDFADAFPSVKREVIFSVLHDIFLEECKSYFYSYKDKKYRILGRRHKLNPVQNNPWKTTYVQKGFNDAYARFPLFSNKECPFFRRLVRTEAKAHERFEDTRMPEIAYALADLVAQIATHKGELPQGAPMSGFLLAVVLSEKKITHIFSGDVSVYVDNIFVSTKKKPTEEMIRTAEERIQQTGIFVLNKKKTKVYDLRNQSAPLLGMKLVKRPARPDEMEQLRRFNYEYSPRGFQKRDKTGRSWEVKHLSLAKDKQKQYRALIHKCIIGDPEPDFLAKVHGYIGHLVSIYGWPAPNMPSCLSKLVHAFREKYKIYKH